MEFINKQGAKSKEKREIRGIVGTIAGLANNVPFGWHALALQSRALWMWKGQDSPVHYRGWDFLWINCACQNWPLCVCGHWFYFSLTLFDCCILDGAYWCEKSHLALLINLEITAEVREEIGAREERRKKVSRCFPILAPYSIPRLGAKMSGAECVIRWISPWGIMGMTSLYFLLVFPQSF